MCSLLLFLFFFAYQRVAECSAEVKIIGLCAFQTPVLRKIRNGGPECHIQVLEFAKFSAEKPNRTLLPEVQPDDSFGSSGAIEEVDPLSPDVRALARLVLLPRSKELVAELQGRTRDPEPLYYDGVVHAIHGSLVRGCYYDLTIRAHTKVSFDTDPLTIVSTPKISNYFYRNLILEFLCPDL